VTNWANWQFRQWEMYTKCRNYAGTYEKVTNLLN